VIIAENTQSQSKHFTFAEITVGNSISCLSVLLSGCTVITSWLITPSLLLELHVGQKNIDMAFGFGLY
jgi:hypothetical protein